MSRAVGQRVHETIREAYGDRNGQAMTDHLAGGHRDDHGTAIVSTMAGHSAMELRHAMTGLGVKVNDDSFANDRCCTSNDSQVVQVLDVERSTIQVKEPDCREGV